MTKVIWNPLNPNITYIDYEKYVGDCIEEQIKTPGYVASQYNNLIKNLEDRRSIEQVHLQRRPTNKSKWIGASGYLHQIDVSFSTEDERVILLVECKHWTKSVDFPTFSAFLIRVIDIAMSHKNSTVLGMLVTTQGPKGKTGSKEEDRDCIENVRLLFSQMRYYVIFELLTDTLDL